jgi:hypothetical protein
VLLIWIYYTAQLVLMGAEFTNVYARRYGSRRDAVERRPGEGPSAKPGRARRLIQPNGADRIGGRADRIGASKQSTNTSRRENNHGSAAISFGIAEQRRIRLGKSDIGGGQAYVHFLRPTFRSADVPALCFKSVPQFANELAASRWLGCSRHRKCL